MINRMCCVSVKVSALLCASECVCVYDGNMRENVYKLGVYLIK